jgi:hypothetical protein
MIVLLSCLVLSSTGRRAISGKIGSRPGNLRICLNQELLDMTSVKTHAKAF